jgi:cytochrome P450
VSALASQEVLRPGPRGLKRWVVTRLQAALPFGFSVLRRVRPILRLGSTYVVTLHDDVREVFGTDAAFRVPYKPNLDVITGGEPFFLGMADTPEYHAGIEAMRRVVHADDLPGLARRAEARAEEIVSRSGGRVEVVGQLVRRVSFDMLAEYFGVPEPAGGRLDVWATRLFEFQFASSPKDLELRAQVDEIAPAFRAHIDRVIASRKAEGNGGRDDVLARCLALQRAGESGYDDVEIRTALLCMIVGGPPQPPMVVPQAMEQLLRRPDALAAARAAALADHDSALHRIVLEAMRFDPLAPGLPRVATREWTVARGTRRERTIPEGATVLAAFASAMMDERRVPAPGRFDPDRRRHEYIHFGYGLHECFGRHINGATLHMMLKPLLKRSNLRRAPDPEGRLTKNGPFAERLVVEFG